MAIKIGTSGNDNIQGSQGTDYLYGLTGNDKLYGNNGTDLLSGGSGKDTLEGGAGADTLNGGAGGDTFLYSSYRHAHNDTIIDFGVGDSLDFSKIKAHHFIGNQAFKGIAGEIRYTYQPAYNQGAIPFTSSVDKTSVEIDSNGDGEADVILTLNGRINLLETQVNSGKITFAQGVNKSGTLGNDKIVGGSGNDTLSGLNGTDVLLGGEGNDRLLGGNGNDTLDGGFGLDTLTGGLGKDIFRFSEMGSNYESITDFSDNDLIIINIPGLHYIGDQEFTGTPGEYRFYQGTDKFNQSRLEFDSNGDFQTDAAILFGANFNQMLQKNNAGNLIIASNKSINGNNIINGTVGNDNLNGGMGNDRVNGGGAGHDTLNGGSGNDIIKGGVDADILIGGEGIDTLTGGLGKDIFKFLTLDELQSPSPIFTPFTPNETITDFASGDKIDLSGIDADSNFAKNQKFTFINSKDFSGIAGELRYDAINHFLQADINGDTEVDFTLELTGVTSLKSTDFVL